MQCAACLSIVHARGMPAGDRSLLFSMGVCGISDRVRVGCVMSESQRLQRSTAGLVVTVTALRRSEGGHCNSECMRKPRFTSVLPVAKHPALACKSRRPLVNVHQQEWKLDVDVGMRLATPSLWLCGRARASVTRCECCRCSVVVCAAAIVGVYQQMHAFAYGVAPPCFGGSFCLLGSGSFRLGRVKTTPLRS